MEKCIPGQYDSWLILNDNMAIKHTDKSFFNHKSSGLPRAIKAFWGVEEYKSGESKEIVFVFNGKKYQGRIVIEKSDTKRARLFWKSDLVLYNI